MNVRTKGLAGAAAVAAALGLAACGGGSDGDSTTAAPLSASAVTRCLEDAGQKVRKVEASFAKLPPDLGVSSQAGSGNVWFTDDTQAVVDQTRELAQLDKSDALTIDDRIIEGNGAVAVVSSTSSPDYKTTLEGCVPPAS